MRNTLLLPDNQVIIEKRNPQFMWDYYPHAVSYILNVKKLVDWEYVPYKSAQIDGYTNSAYTFEEPLDENEIYSWNVTAILEDGTKEETETYYFAGPFNPKTHPANVGLDFEFNGPPSKEVLNNYLSRGVNCFILDENWNCGGLVRFEENLRMLLYTGAKYIQRATAGDCWDLSPEKIESHPRLKVCIEKAHKFDPDLIFEGGVYEIVNSEVNRTKIPAFVFEAFDLPVEDRNFIMENMVYEDGRYTNFLPNCNIPDISRLETQMWFYYRARLFIDVGCESVHLGSTPIMSENDSQNGYKGWKRITSLLREYAKTHSRRGWVLLNGHTLNMKTDDDELIFDFNAWTLQPIIPKGQVEGPPTEDHPQKIDINLYENEFAIYGITEGGKHPCGYTVERAPYVVEFDNYGIISDIIDKPCGATGGYPWGMEDIAWFYRQPTEYRRSCLDYLYYKLKDIDGVCGHITMPLLRLYCTRFVRSNLPEFGYSTATGDEVAVRNVFIKDNEMRNAK